MTACSVCNLRVSIRIRFRTDSDIDGERVARGLGYSSFETFLGSEEMASRVIITNTTTGAPLYKVYPAKADLEGYVNQRIGTDNGVTRYETTRMHQNRTNSKRCSPFVFKFGIFLGQLFDRSRSIRRS